MASSAFTIMAVNQENEKHAQKLILEGLKEHFGFIDHTLNPDLYPILKTYTGEPNVLYVGYYQGVLVATGAIVKEEERVGRVTRLSVAKKWRGKGFAKAMLAKLEVTAEHKGYAKLVLETNHHWTDAIHLYQKAGYSESHKDETSIHMYKDLKTDTINRYSGRSS
ncbi:GNAT family N-acetyltransferase [Camelliibacillus cellulosilyticus]|uniref:GNAT family N-acetyltransferase n=1 Tax=Camelliibacillus cellulosilyticus TaxID=2174486 RepID=A0ABV9GQF6_9BACL